MNFEWKCAFGRRCFERRFPKYESLSHFCTTLFDVYPEGLCSCVIVRELSHWWEYGARYDLLCSKLEFCAGALPFVPTCVRGLGWNPRLQKEWHEQQKLEAGALPSCGCTISSLEEICKY